MLRSFILALLAGAVVFAQPTQPPKPDDLPKKDAPAGKDPPAPTSDFRALTVAPAHAAIPALKYELLPRPCDRKPGNAALGYHRAYMLRPTWPGDPKEAAKLNEILIAWEETPVDKLPLVEVKKYLASHAQSFRALDAGALADRCDWDLAGKLSVNNIDLLLAEVQTFRELARFQVLRIRVNLAENDFDEAVRNIQTGVRLGKDVGEGPTLIHSLVGIAIVSIFHGRVEQLIQRPDSPNMYWALTTLPRPMIDPRPSLEGETRLFDNLFPNAKALEKGPVSAERASAVLEEMLTAFNSMGKPDDSKVGLGGLGLAGYVALNAPAARKQLETLGWPAATLEKMPPAQVIALRAITIYRAISDDQLKCFSLPYPDARAEIAKLRERAEKLKTDAGDPIVTAFTLSVRAFEKVFEAHARMNRRIAMLRAVEAIRLHAAANDGKLPKTLAEVKLVPIPDDPNTLKPFDFAVDGNKFTLTGLPPAGEKPDMINCMKYEVTLRAK
ncbi:MAG: hypothetical protein L0241_00490 [Planctomycetia bacterium]|nr:hypothetical protein [Planctomycetia bacterium]